MAETTKISTASLFVIELILLLELIVNYKINFKFYMMCSESEMKSNAKGRDVKRDL